ncbi:MAG: cytochrome d ubiquinol oxidase subunit II, partial [Bacteroidales bacterium]|nr:cytochrome d ubiquinol oxidase subunit II [Bacteroidales bacterium]
LYFINNVNEENIRSRASVRLVGSSVPFVILFVAFLVRTLLKDGYAVNPETGIIFMEPMKYLHNFITMWYLIVVLLIGVILVLYGIGRTIVSRTYIKGIWPAGIGTVLTVLALLLCAGWNNTAYYPSTADLQSSLTLSNSCSSEFTLRTMTYVSVLVPFVLAYIVYAWRAIDRKPITSKELEQDGHAY